MSLTITREWAMPSAETFTIKPIFRLIARYLQQSGNIWVDPFVRNSTFKPVCELTNDLDLNFEATHHVEALEFLKGIGTNSVDGVLFDPPY